MEPASTFGNLDRTRPWLFAGLIVLLLSACERHAAIVTYQQIGACNGLDNLHGAGPNTVFVAFYIESIDNTKTGQDLDFLRSRIQTSNYEPANGVATNQYSTALGIPPLGPKITVPKGSKAAVHNNVWFILGTGDPDGAKEANATNFFLRYDTPEGGPGVAMTKIDPTRTNWPYTPRCADMQFRKSPLSGIGHIEEGVNHTAEK